MKGDCCTVHPLRGGVQSRGAVEGGHSGGGHHGGTQWRDACMKSGLNSSFLRQIKPETTAGSHKTSCTDMYHKTLSPGK